MNKRMVTITVLLETGCTKDQILNAFDRSMKPLKELVIAAANSREANIGEMTIEEIQRDVYTFNALEDHWKVEYK